MEPNCLCVLGDRERRLKFGKHFMGMNHPTGFSPQGCVHSWYSRMLIIDKIAIASPEAGLAFRLRDQFMVLPACLNPLFGKEVKALPRSAQASMYHMCTYSVKRVNR